MTNREIETVARPLPGLLFVGDAGTTEASKPSRRVGVEWTNHYKVNPWLALDLDVAFTRARFVGESPEGNFIPGAPNAVVSAGLVLGRNTGWYGANCATSVRGPLVEDNAVQSLSSTVVNARLGYKFDNGESIQLDAFNLFNARTKWNVPFPDDTKLVTMREPIR